MSDHDDNAWMLAAIDACFQRIDGSFTAAIDRAIAEIEEMREPLLDVLLHKRGFGVMEDPPP